VLQPLDGLGEACREHDALFLLDCVTSLAGAPLILDQAGVDVAFSGTQKCLNCPPGLAPFTAGPRAIDKLRARETRVRSWYFDLSLVLSYWNPPTQPGSAPRAYHHTAPINMVYALHEALSIVAEEGLAARWHRHAEAHDRLLAALRTLGFERLAPEGEQLAPLLAVTPPEGVDVEGVRMRLLTEHGIEVSAGVGDLKGQVWRIGVMGVGAERGPQERLVRAVATELGRAPDEAVAAL